jgi:hypothetical protein
LPHTRELERTGLGLLALLLGAGLSQLFLLRSIQVDRRFFAVLTWPELGADLCPMNHA